MKLQPCKNSIRGWKSAAGNFEQTVLTLMGAETRAKSWQSSTEKRATLFRGSALTGMGSQHGS